MTEQELNPVQVASLLISTSCGVGFLLGTGELAIRQGMAACLYPIATALGLTVLALCSRLLWASGQSIWTWFNQLYGHSVGQRVALLSLIWMTGVLAAQVRGAEALLILTGLSPRSALLVTDAALLLLSAMRLPRLSVGFAICMLACNAALVGSLIETHGIEIWLNAPLRFFDTFPRLSPVHTIFTMISIIVMVVCGADYQQFLIGARTPATARNGCIFAAGIVFALGFLPASTVIATAATGRLDHLGDPAQAIPVVLIRTLSSHATSTMQILVIAMLTSTALGAGCAVLRAMSDATTTLYPGTVVRPIWSRVLPVLFGSLVATREQSLIGMMVDLNIVYITAVGPLLTLALLKVHVPEKTAHAAIMAGCSLAMACYLIRWTGIAAIPDVTALFFAFPILLAVALASWRRTNAFSREFNQLHQPKAPRHTQSPAALSSSLSSDTDQHD